jgi:RRXRR protein/HNH endonuclease
MVRTLLDVCSSLTLCWFSLRVVETRSVKTVKSHLNTREGHHTPEGGLNATMSTLVYVLNRNGQKLMPCNPAKARKLLRAGKARVAGRSPFTIKLLWDCEEQVQEVTLGIDKGSHVTGFSCIGKGQILLSGEIRHRLDVKEKMEARRIHRRSRRNRKWYRPKRFLNRASSKRSGRLPSSIRANVEEVIRVVRHIPLPISKIIVEDVQVDIARLNNPSLKGSQYQEPTRLDENLRMACLMRDGYSCQHCGKRSVRLEAHHLIERSQGGKDTLTNLLTLCERCHHKLHEGKITLKVTGVSGHLDRLAQRTMQGKSYLYAALGAQTSLSRLFGYQTATLRKARDLPKEHDADALCLAIYATGEMVPYNREHFYTVSFRPRRTRRQYHDLPRKGQGRVRYQVNQELEGFRKGDVVCIKGKHVKQINSIYSNGYLAFPRVKGEPTQARPQDCQLLERERTILWEKSS